MDMDDVWGELTGLWKTVVKKATESATEYLSPSTPLEKSLKEATSDEAWAAPNSLLREIASEASNYQNYHIILKAVSTGFDSPPAQWRKICKCLTLLEVLLVAGPPRLQNDATNHIDRIRELARMQFYEQGHDKAGGVRQAAQRLIGLLTESGALDAARELDGKEAEKYVGYGCSSGTLYDDGRFGSQYSSNASNMWRAKPPAVARYSASGIRKNVATGSFDPSGRRIPDSGSAVSASRYDDNKDEEDGGGGGGAGDDDGGNSRRRPCPPQRSVVAARRRPPPKNFPDEQYMPSSTGMFAADANGPARYSSSPSSSSGDEQHRHHHRRRHRNNGKHHHHQQSWSSYSSGSYEIGEDERPSGRGDRKSRGREGDADAEGPNNSSSNAGGGGNAAPSSQVVNQVNQVNKEKTEKRAPDLLLLDFGDSNSPLESAHPPPVMTLDLETEKVVNLPPSAAPVGMTNNSRLVSLLDDDDDDAHDDEFNSANANKADNSSNKGRKALSPEESKVLKPETRKIPHPTATAKSPSHTTTTIKNSMNLFEDDNSEKPAEKQSETIADLSLFLPPPPVGVYSLNRPSDNEIKRDTNDILFP